MVEIVMIVAAVIAMSRIADLQDESSLAWGGITLLLCLASTFVIPLAADPHWHRLRRRLRPDDDQGVHEIKSVGRRDQTALTCQRLVPSSIVRCP